MVYRSASFLTATLLGLSVMACSNTPEDPDEEISAEVDEVLGRERPDYEGQGTLERMFGGGSDADDEEQAAIARAANQRLQALEQRMARLEQQLASVARDDGREPAREQPDRNAARAAAPAPALGILLTDAAQDQTGSGLQRTLGRAAAEAGMSFAGSAAIAERLAEAGCGDVTAPGCADELAVYPGTRVLVLVESLRTTSQAAVVSYRLLDTVTGAIRGPRTLRLPVREDGSTPEAALAGAADEILTGAWRLADTAPWQTRAFNRENGQWYLSAGRSAGLAVGDRLVVHGPGRTIATPGGSIAGWVPGERKGVLEVTGFAGDGIAVTRLVQGEAPAPTDPILPADEAGS